VRAETLPLVFRLPGSESLPRGSRVRARVTGIDLLTLDLHATLAARLDVPAVAAEDDSVEDETEPAGVLELAIDLADPSLDPAVEPTGGAPAEDAAAPAEPA
jgi:exoribonuclease-2